ncbi:hypothetical protein [Pseudovibrio sp. Ad37]|uniref:hypothetical protein n=1 Tax=Pseudovibrio sp. Ad37 TaxID=989422 RepID=UPI0007AED5BE|nr:hypothetical protein [Pseudovibrio sp. Ad37]KZL13601.1 hypothetical protein PsAD37_05358 [Pseudovibrio sp. Ad37]
MTELRAVAANSSVYPEQEETLFTRTRKAAEPSPDYICLSRDFLQWEWATDAAVCRLYLHLLLACQKSSRHWAGKPLPDWTIATSVESLRWETGLRVNPLNRALKVLHKHSWIKRQVKHNRSFITLLRPESFLVEARTIRETPCPSQAL